MDGLWHDRRRNRWRVRLYLGGKVLCRSYHRDLNEAITVYRQALAMRSIYSSNPSSVTPPPPRTLADYLIEKS